MGMELLIPVLIFLAITGMVLALTAMRGKNAGRVRVRILSLAGDGPLALAAGAFRVPAEPEPAAGAGGLRERLAHAGYYRPEAEATFKAVRLGGVIAAWVLGLLVVLTELVEPGYGAAGAAGLSAAVWVGAGMWVDRRRAARQREFRKALPDFFDMLVVCLESGLGLAGGWRRVNGEMRDAYPTLHAELTLADREMELGGAMGDAIRRCATRTGLDEMASLASVVSQAERLGTGLAKPLRVLADTLRQQRVQRAEEQAHKAATKIMFPTLLFIFPGVFAIILGPMAIQVMNLFSGGK